jgi:tetratricopeptide (TPR) repeat protein
MDSQLIDWQSDPWQLEVTHLWQAKRYDLAEKMLREVLRDDPNNPRAHAMLAYTLLEREELHLAETEIKSALALSPEFAYAHYVSALISGRRPWGIKKARNAAEEAIRLDPYEPDYYALLSGILIDSFRANEALTMTTRGLDIDPEHIGCANIRGMALIRLERYEEASAAIEIALGSDPELAVTQANYGWLLLYRGDYKGANEHFHEALRLDPQLDWAREGLIEAAKAHKVIYTPLLKLSLRFQRAGITLRLALFPMWLAYCLLWIYGIITGTEWMILVLGGVIVLGGLVAATVALSHWLVLHDRYARLSLTSEQIKNRNAVTAALVYAIAFAAVYWISGNPVVFIPCSTVGIVMVASVLAVYSQERWHRYLLAFLAVLIALSGGIGSFIMISEQHQVDGPRAMLGLAFYLGAVVITIIAMTMYAMELERRKDNAKRR